MIQHWRHFLGETGVNISGDAFNFAWEFGLISSEEYIDFFCFTGSQLISNEGTLKTLEVHFGSVKKCEYFYLFILLSLLFGVD